jgi:O-antigen ligase
MDSSGATHGTKVLARRDDTTIPSKAVVVLLAAFFGCLALYQLPDTRIAGLDAKVPYFVVPMAILVPLALKAMTHEFLSRNAWLIACLGVLVLATLITGAAHPSQDWVEAIKRIGYLTMGIMVLAITGRTRTYLIVGLATYAIVAVGMSIYGFGLLLQGYGESAQLFYFGLHYTTATRNGDAYFILLPLFLSLGFMAAPDTSRGLRLVAGASLVVLAAALTLSFARGAWLGAAAGAFAYLWLARSRRRWILAGAITFIVVLIVGSSILTSQSVGDLLTARLSTIFTLDAGPTVSNAQRVALLQATAQLIAENPFLGVGVGNVGIALTSTQLAGLMHVEDGYLNSWVEYGLLGFAAVALLTFIPIERVWLATRHRTDNFAIAAWAGLVALAVTGLFDTQLSSASYWVMPLCLMGYRSVKSSIATPAGAIATVGSNRVSVGSGSIRSVPLRSY